MTGFALRAPLYFCAQGFALPRHQTLVLLTRVLLYLTMVGVWAYTFSLMPDTVWAQIDLRWVDLVWYVAVAEVGTFTIGAKHKEIQYQCREGHFHSHLTRPVSWLTLWSGREIGEGMAAVLLFTLVGFTFAFVLTGFCPVDPVLWPLLLLKLVLAATIWLALITIIGLTTLWLGSPYVPFWVSQKLLFVLGGMVIPLHLYPEWAQTLAYLTPFPAILAIPAQMTIPDHMGSVAVALGYQALVLAVVLTALVLMWRAFVHKMLKEG